MCCHLQPHWHACFGEGDLHIKCLTERLDENLRRRRVKSTVVPAVENNSVNTVHHGSLFHPVHGGTNVAVSRAVISAAYTSPIFADAGAVALRHCWIDNKTCSLRRRPKFAKAIRMLPVRQKAVIMGGGSSSSSVLNPAPAFRPPRLR